MSQPLKFRSDSICQRQALEHERLGKVDERLISALPELQGRVEQVAAVLKRVVDSQAAALRQAGVTAPIEFSLRAEAKAGPGCIFSHNRYLIAAGSRFVAEQLVLKGDPAPADLELTRKLDEAPDDLQQLVHYAKEQFGTEPELLSRRYRWIDEATLEGIFLHELGHIVHGDPVGLYAVTPQWVKNCRPPLILAIALLFGGVLIFGGLKPVPAIGVGVAVAIPTAYTATWAGWKGYSSMDGPKRERELRADQTLFETPAAIEAMARQFKRDTVLEAAFHLRSGKSEAETIELLQREAHDHPQPLTRWRLYQKRLA